MELESPTHRDHESAQRHHKNQNDPGRRTDDASWQPVRSEIFTTPGGIALDHQAHV